MCITRLDKVRNEYIEGSLKMAPVTNKLKKYLWTEREVKERISEEEKGASYCVTVDRKD